MLPVDPNDPVNERILAISEDKLEGFMPEPFQEISTRSGLEVETVMLRIAAMLRAGTIRRVRQTLLATNLAEGALVAWKVPEGKIDAAFDFMLIVIHFPVTWSFGQPIRSPLDRTINCGRH